MSEPVLCPLKFAPIFQYRLWGGRTLGDWMQTPIPDGPVGEAWILSDRADHASQVVDGPLKGATITELMARYPKAMLGRLAARFDRFPLLLKFLDVHQMLSVQVHPRDDQHELIAPGDTGKTEAWMVLKAEAGARIYAGLKPGTTAHDLRALTTATADRHLASFTPEVGQGVLIEAGTVHSLGDGVLVFEVQENSDTTFRLYDWDHVDAKTGKPRDLQVDQALACIDLGQGAIRPVKPVDDAPEGDGAVQRRRYFADPHFELWRVESAAGFEVGAPEQPRILVCAEGGGAVEYAGGDITMKRGEVVLLPAETGACRVRPTPSITLFEIAIPDPP